MKKKAGLLLSLTLAASTILAACGNGGDDKATEEQGGGKETADFKVGMVTDVGGVDDKSFNQSAWEGLTAFGKENGLTENEGYRYLQSTADAEYLPNLTKFAESNYNLTFGIGFLLADAVGQAADQFPNNNFAIIDMVVDKPNVASITFKEHEGSFLVGVVAALSTKTNKVGFVGGVDSDLIKKFEYGFKAGVASVNPKIEVISQYAGAFNDAAKGTQLASTMYGQGADIIYHAAGGTGNGVFTEAKNRKKQGQEVWVIGVDKDQHEEGLPENVTLTSMVKRVDIAVQQVSKQTMDGSFPGGKIVEFGLEDQGVGIAPTKTNVSQEAQDKVAEFEKKILSGELKVPATEDEYKTYEASLQK